MTPNPSTVDALAELIRETLALDEGDEISANKLLFYDLDFTSIDLLDLLFRVEEELGVGIPEGTIYRLARGDLDDAEFCDAGHLTDAGRAQLIELLSDSPPSIFPDRIHHQTLPKYCTVGAIARLIDAARVDPGMLETG